MLLHARAEPQNSLRPKKNYQTSYICHKRTRMYSEIQWNKHHTGNLTSLREMPQQMQLMFIWIQILKCT